MNRNELRGALFNGGKPLREPVTLVGSDGSTLEVEVIGLTNDGRGKLLNDCTIVEPDPDSEDGATKERMDMAKLGPSLVIECTVMKGTDEKIFTEADRDGLGALGATYLDPIIKTASRISGLGQGQAKVAEGN